MTDHHPTGAPQLLRIGEVAARAHVRRDTLRYYERRGLMAPATRSRAGYRLYGPDAVERVAFIKKAQTLGLTLDQVAEVIAVSLDGPPPCDHVRRTLTDRLAEVDQRLADLRTLRRTLVHALERPDDPPRADGCLCGIIESQVLPTPLPNGGTPCTRSPTPSAPTAPPVRR